MKQLIAILLLTGLISGCHSNEWMCETTHPSKMTDRELEYCKAYVNKNTAIVYQ